MCKSIYIIDDYPINLKIAEMILKNHGYFKQITSFIDAEKALGSLIACKNECDCLPDFILLDLNMPHMDGWQFLDEFEDIKPLLHKQVVVYILSSSMDERDRQRSKLYPSVKGFFSKPLNIHMLCSMISNDIASVS